MDPNNEAFVALEDAHLLLNAVLESQRNALHKRDWEQYRVLSSDFVAAFVQVQSLESDLRKTLAT